MVNKITKYGLLTSGFSFDETESDLLFRFRILNYFLLIGTFFAGLIGLLGEFGIMKIGEIQPLADFAYAMVNIYLVLKLRQSKEFYNRIALAEVISLYILIVIALVSVETDEFRMVWFYVVAFCSYLLLNISGGIFFTGLSIVSIVLANNLMDLHLTDTAIYTAVFGLIVIGILSWASVTQLNEYELLRLKQNKKLRKNLNKLDTALTEAKEANRIKSIFLANMSHEIRTPMNGMLTIAQVMRTTELNEKQKSYLDSIEHSGELLKTLIDDLLDVSSIESGKLIINPRTVNIRSFVQDIVLQIKPLFHNNDSDTDLFGNNKVNLKYRVEETVPEYLVVDDIRLNQIIVNLVSNAQKFTKTGDVELIIGGTAINNETFNTQIIVSDTGIGIPVEKIDAIFETFHQLTEDRSQNNGVGLGLSISKRIIDAMNGRISVESTVGKGTTFVVDIALPVVKTDQQQPVGQNSALQKITALLVEDDNISRFAVKTLLNDQGHDVLIAENGRQALEILRQNTVDIILMDVHMPELNGIEATKIIKSEKISNAPIVGMSASVMQDERQSYYQAGMDALLEKPLRIEQLIAMIRQKISA